jgi:hypothetical protein
MRLATFIVCLHQHAFASVPESCFAVTVALPEPEMMRQAHLVAAKRTLTNWSAVELSHHDLPVRAGNAATSACFHAGWEQLNMTARTTRQSLPRRRLS